MSRRGSSISVEYINPPVTSVINVFRRMFNMELVREVLFMHREFARQFEGTAMIWLTGATTGASPSACPGEMANWQRKSC